jgi:hypothetical protein
VYEMAFSGIHASPQSGTIIALSRVDSGPFDDEWGGAA